MTKNKINLESIREIVKNEENMFLVGAGVSISKPSNGLTALNISKKIIDKLIIDKNLNFIVKESIKYKEGKPYLRFEEFIGILCFTFDSDINIARFFNLMREPNINHFSLAKILNINNSICTTNFDILIEEAAERLKKQFQSLVFEDDFANPKEQLPVVTKLHGSVGINIDEFEKYIKSVKITLGELGRSGVEMQNEIKKKNYFANEVKSRNKIVIGYSGGDNTDIIPILINEFGNDTKLIWLQHTSGDDFYNVQSIDDIPDKNIRNIFLKIKSIHKINENNLIYLEGNTTTFLIKISNINQSNIDIKRNSELNFSKFIDQWIKQYVKRPEDWLFIVMQIAKKINDNNLAKMCWGFTEKIESKLPLTTFSSVAYTYLTCITENIDVPESEVKTLLDRCIKIDRTLFEKEPNLIRLQRYLINSEILMTFYLRQGEISAYKETYSRVLEAYKENNLTEGIIRLLLKNSQVYLRNKDYNEYENEIQQAISLADKIGDFFSIAECFQRLGICHYEMGINSTGDVAKQLFSQSIDELKKGLHYYSIIYNLKGKAEMYMELFHPYSAIGDYTNALKYIDEAIHIQKEILNDFEAYARCLKVKANYYIENNDFKTALKLAEESAYYTEKVGNKNSLSRTYQLLYRIYYHLQDISSMLKYVDLSDENAIITEDLRTFYDNISNRLIFSLEYNNLDGFNYYKSFLKYITDYPNLINERTMQLVTHFFITYYSLLDIYMKNDSKSGVYIHNGQMLQSNFVKFNCSFCNKELNYPIPISNTGNNITSYLYPCTDCKGMILIIMDEKNKRYLIANDYVKDVANPFKVLIK